MRQEMGEWVATPLEELRLKKNDKGFFLGSEVRPPEVRPEEVLPDEDRPAEVRLYIRISFSATGSSFLHSS